MDQPKTIRFIPSRFLESFVAVARELILRPARFFEQLRPSGSLFGLFTFLIVCLFVRWLFVANVIGAPASLFAAFFVSWVVSAVLGTMCLHAVLVSPLFNARVPYEATLSVIAYACIVDLAAFIPLVNIVASIYGLCLMYIGFKAIHQLTARRAAFAVFLAVLIIGIIRVIMIRFTASEWLDSMLQAIESSSIPV